MGESIPPYIRLIQGHWSRPVVNSEVFKHMFEILHGWTNEILSLKNTAVLRQNYYDWQADKHVSSRPRIFNDAKVYLIRKVGSHEIVLDFHHKWHTDTVFDIHLVSAFNSQSGTFLFISVMFQQNFLQESSDTIKRSCMIDIQMSHRTHQQSEHIWLIG